MCIADKFPEPFRFANRPQVLRCKGCKRDTALTAGTVMERTHTPLSVWFWAAFLAMDTLGVNRISMVITVIALARPGNG
jgi:hypothetical protein